MNCRDAEKLIFAEHDGALTIEERAVLARHVAECASCRRMQSALTTATAVLRSAAAGVTVPDAEREWQRLQARLATPASRRTAARRLAPVAWIGLPLAAAAALTVAYLGGRSPTGGGGGPTDAAVARAEFVEVKDASASPLVYVDKESGWLVVWAVPDGSAKG
jgi:predicted anti-sigma-YlaC factor YlaD